MQGFSSAVTKYQSIWKSTCQFHCIPQCNKQTAQSCKPISLKCTSSCHLAITFLSLKPKALVPQLGRLARGALADKELADEMVRTLHSGAKDTNAVEAKNRCHLGKAGVYTAEDVVQLREERERLHREKVTKAEMRQEMAAAKVVLSWEGSKSSIHVEKRIIGTKKAPEIVLSTQEN